MAVDLLEHHSPLTVSQALGINPKTLSRWKEKRILVNPEKEVDFIALPLVEMVKTLQEVPLPSAVMKPMELRMKLPGDLELIIPEQPIKQTMELIRGLSQVFSS
jgi:hypothetical protein